MIDTFVQPKILGYRQLTAEDAEMMNRIKAAAEDIGALVAEMRTHQQFDGRWISIGATELQQGFMALTRAVAQPTTF